MDRTLCLVDENDFIENKQQKSEDLTIIVSTRSNNPIAFQLKLDFIENFPAWVHGNAPSVRKVSVTSPVFYFIDFRDFEKDSLLQVKVKSNDDTCAIISMQRFLCPIYDIQGTAIAQVLVLTFHAVPSACRVASHTLHVWALVPLIYCSSRRAQWSQL